MLSLLALNVVPLFHAACSCFAKHISQQGILQALWMEQHLHRRTLSQAVRQQRQEILLQQPLSSKQSVAHGHRQALARKTQSLQRPVMLWRAAKRCS